MKVKSDSEVVQLCLTPHDPMDCSLPGSSTHGIFQAKVLEWGAIDSSDRQKIVSDKKEPLGGSDGKEFASHMGALGLIPG